MGTCFRCRGDNDINFVGAFNSLWIIALRYFNVNSDTVGVNWHVKSTLSCTTPEIMAVAPKVGLKSQPRGLICDIKFTSA